PQDLKFVEQPTRLKIGDRNIFREHTTVHRSTKPGEETVIGSHNLLMHHAHVAHNVIIANHAIIAGGAMLAGHRTVGDRAVVSGNCLVHQFTRVGTLAMMQGGSAISKDLPPYTVARGYNTICGLNIIGLRRAGISAADRLELKQVYRKLFREGVNLSNALAAAQGNFSSAPAKELLAFIGAAKRGVCMDKGRGGVEEEEAEE